MISETDPAFIKWGIRACCSGETQRSPNLFIISTVQGTEYFPMHTRYQLISKGDHVIVNQGR
jgi:hypothetical protein